MTLSPGLARLMAEGAGRACQFGMIYAAQRRLGPVAYGEFSVLLGIAFLASVCADFGIQLTTTRRLSAVREAVAETAGNALWMRGALALAVALAALGAGSLLRPGVDIVALAGLVTGLMLSSLAETCGYILRGINGVGRETGMLLNLRVATAAAGIVAVYALGTPRALALAYLTAGLAGLFVAFVVTLQAIPDLRLARPTSDALRSMMRDAAPLGLATAISIAYTRAPLFALDAIRGSVDVAAYSVAQRLTEPLAIIPASLMAPAFPLFAAAAAGSRPVRATSLALRQASIFGAIGLGLAVFLVVGGPWLLAALYPDGQYAGAVAPLRWLALSLIPAFANYALTHLLVAQRRTRLNAVFVAVQLVVGVGLSVALAPAIGPAGAALAMLAGEITLLVLCILAR